MKSLLQTQVDLLLLDQNQEFLDSYLDSITNHIFEFADYFCKDKAQTKGFTRARVLVLVNYRMEFYHIFKRLLAFSERQMEEEDLAEMEKTYNSEETGLFSEVLVGLNVKNHSLFLTKKLQKANILIASPEKLLTLENATSLLASVEIVFTQSL